MASHVEKLVRAGVRVRKYKQVAVNTLPQEDTQGREEEQEQEQGKEKEEEERRRKVVKGMKFIRELERIYTKGTTVMEENRGLVAVVYPTNNKMNGDDDSKQRTVAKYELHDMKQDNLVDESVVEQENDETIPLQDQLHPSEEIGVAFVDLRHGTFQAGTFRSQNSLDAYIDRIQPSEIIHTIQDKIPPDDDASEHYNEACEERLQHSFHPETRIDHLERNFTTQHALGAKPLNFVDLKHFSEMAVRAMQLILDYLHITTFTYPALQTPTTLHTTRMYIDRETRESGLLGRDGIFKLTKKYVRTSLGKQKLLGRLRKYSLRCHR